MHTVTAACTDAVVVVVAAAAAAVVGGDAGVCHCVGGVRYSF